MSNGSNPYTIKTLEEAVSAFIQANEIESQSQFVQSDVCAAACREENRIEWGMTDDDILAHIGKQAKRGRATMWNRLLVGRVFPPDRRNTALYWSIHEVCAHTYSDDFPDAPHLWLEYAADNDLSVRELRAAIQAQNEDDPLPKTRPVYVLDDARVTVDYWDTRQATILFEAGFEPPIDEDGEVIWPQAGMRLVITAVKQEDPVHPPVAILGEGVQTSGQAGVA